MLQRRSVLLSLGGLAAAAYTPGLAIANTSSPFSKSGVITFTQPTPALLQQLGIDSWPIWEHDIGSFDYMHEADEDCLFLDGAVIITPQGLPSVTVKAGDFVTFPKGLISTWDIQSPVRKHYKEYL